MKKSILITGSGGLIGSEVASFFAGHGYKVYGVDNNQRAKFFGHQGDTLWNQKRLAQKIKDYENYDLDIRHRDAILQLVHEIKPKAIIHAAAQPSHDKAASIPFDDFDINATGTLNLLEATRRSCPESPFIHLSTNKVYGDLPNNTPLIELNHRWEFSNELFKKGIAEDFGVDQCKHSLFGASKLAADILVQEYGKYFDMPTCVLRGGCLTGPNHSGVELHGFLSYLVKCNIERKEYQVYGYKGKQVRDNIHSEDVARLILLLVNSPRSGEVYNIGGGYENSCSILEAFSLIESLTEIPSKYRYHETPRSGDHIVYYTNLAKIRSHFPSWRISIPLIEILRQIAEQWVEK